MDRDCHICLGKIWSHEIIVASEMLASERKFSFLMLYNAPKARLSSGPPIKLGIVIPIYTGLLSIAERI
jgi:hypothetical protein